MFCSSEVFKKIIVHFEFWPAWKLSGEPNDLLPAVTQVFYDLWQLLRQIDILNKGLLGIFCYCLLLYLLNDQKRTLTGTLMFIQVNSGFSCNNESKLVCGLWRFKQRRKEMLIFKNCFLKDKSLNEQRKEFNLTVFWDQVPTFFYLIFFQTCLSQ